MHKLFLKISIIMAALSVILGAFGAHALKDFLDERHLQIFETGVKYQFYHSLGMTLATMLYKEFSNSSILWCCRLFLIGVILFSGSLYTLACFNCLYSFCVQFFFNLDFSVSLIFVFFISIKAIALFTFCLSTAILLFAVANSVCALVSS